MSKIFTYTILIYSRLSLVYVCMCVYASFHLFSFLFFSVSVFFLPVPSFIVVEMQSVRECSWFFLSILKCILVGRVCLCVCVCEYKQQQQQLSTAFWMFCITEWDVLRDGFRYLWYNDLLASNSSKSHKYDSINVDIHLHAPGHQII